MSWNLSWQPDGRCHSFTRESILASAPPSSGVYGLFNFDCQIFIGAAADIQEALLRHESETDFQSQHLRPTGFTFEPCAAELRQTKADELIARFRPVLQTGAALSEAASLSNRPMLKEAHPRSEELKTFAGHQDFPVHERAERPEVRRGFQLKRAQSVALAAVSLAAVVFYLGASTDYSIHDEPASGAHPDPHPGIEATPAKADVGAPVPTRKAGPRSAAKAAPAIHQQAKTNSTAHSAESANLSKNWSVQVSATPAKDAAETLVERLKAKGYDGYVVQAAVKGQTFYRVRVGHFDTREQAESARQSLVSREDYRDAYLTGD
jgi:cell division septation protein DedD